MRVGLLCGSLLCSVSALPLVRPAVPLSRMSAASIVSSTAQSEAEKAVALQKRQMRAAVEARLQTMNDDDILAKSVALCMRAYGLAAQRRFDGACIYLSMGKEVQTGALAETLFRDSKRVFVPKIMGKDHDDLRMFEAHSLEQIAAFPKNKWNIPEPPKAEVLASADPIDAGGIDVVFMPGVAFDMRRARLGHGKAYYDCFLRRLYTAYESSGRPRPVTIGLFFDEQEVPEVPTEAHDQFLDYIVTPTRTIGADLN